MLLRRESLEPPMSQLGQNASLGPAAILEVLWKRWLTFLDIPVAFPTPLQ
jgi:hypothetical protein